MMVFALKMKFWSEKLQEDLRHAETKLKQLAVGALQEVHLIAHLTRSSLLRFSVEDLQPCRAEQCPLCWQQLALTVPLFMPVFIATLLTLQNRKNTDTANCRSWAQAGFCFL